jgi:hypothetical protein
MRLDWISGIAARRHGFSRHRQYARPGRLGTAEVDDRGQIGQRFQRRSRLAVPGPAVQDTMLISAALAGRGRIAGSRWRYILDIVQVSPQSQAGQSRHLLQAGRADRRRDHHLGARRPRLGAIPGSRRPRRPGHRRCAARVERSTAAASAPTRTLNVVLRGKRCMKCSPSAVRPGGGAGARHVRARHHR